MEPTATPQTQQIVVMQPPSIWKSWTVRILLAMIFFMFMLTMSFYAAYSEYISHREPPLERLYGGDENSPDKIAMLDATGTIMPPLTEHLIKSIDRAKEDDHVKGALLVIDSPGGLVTDSHQIYHRLQQLQEKKPVFVYMKRMAASGGYYIAMGAGTKAKIFAEPTTWTGSIGVIIPRFDFSKLSDKIGISSDPLKTGEFKDALSPFRELSDKEKELWMDILQQSLDQFVGIIDSNRENLTEEQVRKLATGEIFTAKDAKENGLVDEIGFEEDAVTALKDQLSLKKARLVSYEFPVSISELLMGSSQSKAQKTLTSQILEASVPRAMYYCSWFPALP